MTYRGKVKDGVVVLPKEAILPEGTEVDVAPVESKYADVRPDEASVWQELISLGRSVESRPSDLPNDLAANHDHYLHGLPKRV